MRAKFQDSEFRTKERDRIRAKRQNSKYRAKEKVANRSRMQAQRQDPENKAEETAANRSRMQAHRLDPENRNKEYSRMRAKLRDPKLRTKERYRKRAKRQDSKYKAKENVANRSRMQTQRQDSEYRAEETAANRSRMQQAQRLDPEYRNKEYSKWRDGGKILLKRVQLRKKNHVASNKTAWDRIRNFRSAVRDGLIFTCFNCRRLHFRNQVVVYDEELQSKIRAKHKVILEQCISKPEVFLKQLGQFWICHTCANHFIGGKIPPMSHSNNLQLTSKDYFDFDLTELENRLIALNLPFQMIYQTPKYRWHKTKRQLVNIPITGSDIVNKINYIPRMSKETALVNVQLKRKKSMKSTVLTVSSL